MSSLKWAEPSGIRVRIYFTTTQWLLKRYGSDDGEQWMNILSENHLCIARICLQHSINNKNSYIIISAYKNLNYFFPIQLKVGVETCIYSEDHITKAFDSFA